MAAVRPPKEPEADSTASPVLLLVAADVDHGTRWIASDVRVDPNTFVDAADLLTGRELLDSYMGEKRTRGCTADHLRTERERPSDEEPTIHALPASTAVGASLRFPWISPPGLITVIDDTVRAYPDGTDTCLNGEEPELRRRGARLIDGGLVESSAATTVADVLRLLARKCEYFKHSGANPKAVSNPTGVLECKVVKPSRLKSDPADPHLYPHLCPPGHSGCSGAVHVYVRPAVLQLTNDAWHPLTDEDRKARETGEPSQPSTSELFAPIRALLASRTGRGKQAYDQLARDETLQAGWPDLDHELSLERHNDSMLDERVPLTWSLSEHSLASVRQRAAAEFKEPSFRQWAERVFPECQRGGAKDRGSIADMRDDSNNPGFPGWIGVRPAPCTNFRW